MFSENGRISEVLPSGVKRELFSIASSRKGGYLGFSELRLSVGCRSSVVSRGERIYLGSRISPSDIGEVVRRICKGALYAYRDTITEGYLALEGGVRVGVCGHARYEGDRLVGISDISSLVFRIPTATSELIDQLIEAFNESRRGMLIYSKVGGGKTTALRSLVSAISVGKGAMRVAVVDERCEFSPEECARCGVDLLRGYKRALGVEIALRSMAPEVVVIDEIGARREAEAMIDSMNSGVRILASAHAASLSELKRRSSLIPFFEHGIFDTYIGIFNTDGVFRCEISREGGENA